jgi:hypothetical protein
MMNRRQLWFFPLVLSFLLAGCSADGKILRQSSEDWAQLRLDGNYIVFNNVWNKKATSGPYRQSIFEDEERGRAGFGWQWEWPASQTVVSYPEVIFGDKPWDKPVGLVPEFPFHPGQKRLVADYDVLLEATGAYNLAFELWPVSAVPGNKDVIKSEIMIWIAHQNLTPAGEKVGDLEVDGTAFDVWVKKGHCDASGVFSNTWDYVAFVAHRPVLKGPLDISAFLNYLLKKGLVEKEHYITSVELGNEIISGKGIARIRDYRISIR